MVRNALINSRFMIFIPVVGAWLAALMTMGFGVYEIVTTLSRVSAAANDKVLKTLTVNLIEGVDLFLLSTAFYLIALGLYKLFIDARLDPPAWLSLRNFDDLKSKLIKVVVVVLGVQYVGQVLNLPGGIDVLYNGVGTALVIAALSFFLSPKDKPGRKVPTGAGYDEPQQEKK